jgi:hypothetical protein
VTREELRPDPDERLRADTKPVGSSHGA